MQPNLEVNLEQSHYPSSPCTAVRAKDSGSRVAKPMVCLPVRARASVCRQESGSESESVEGELELELATVQGLRFREHKLPPTRPRCRYSPRRVARCIVPVPRSHRWPTQNCLAVPDPSP